MEIPPEGKISRKKDWTTGQSSNSETNDKKNRYRIRGGNRDAVTDQPERRKRSSETSSESTAWRDY